MNGWIPNNNRTIICKSSQKKVECMKCSCCFYDILLKKWKNCLEIKGERKVKVKEKEIFLGNLGSGRKCFLYSFPFFFSVVFQQLSWEVLFKASFTFKWYKISFLRVSINLFNILLKETFHNFIFFSANLNIRYLVFIVLILLFGSRSINLKIKMFSL